MTKGKTMTVLYVRNQWGKCMPIQFTPCCAAMTLQYNPENSLSKGFELDNATGKMIWKELGGKLVKELDECPHCLAPIQTVEKQIRYDD